MAITGAKKLTAAPEVRKKSHESGRFPPLWIHTAAGPQMGFGHLGRCMILAGELRDCARAFFVLRPDDPWSVGPLKAHGFKYQNVDFSDLWRESAIRPAAVLIDTRLSGGLDAFISTAKEKNVPVLSLHDSGLNPLCSDIAVDGSIAGTSHRDLPARRTFVGPAYMVLDPALHKLRRRPLLIGNEIRSIFVGLGGGDARKYFSRVLDGLRLWAAGTERAVEVTGMRGFVDWGQDDFNDETLRPLRFHWESGPAAGFLRNSDLAVTSGGVSAYEALCSGTPLLALSWDSLQQATIDRIDEAGGCVNLGAGNDLAPEFLAGLLEKMAGDAAAREKMARCGMKIVDGRGAKRVAAIVRRAILRREA
ncbi:MAG: hypothetical protein FWF13_00755 [Acidobacteria bacterium]|nr:hypothetical protein [Acidobacteriota bacterium]